jgi:NADH-quinone oxidoreductase subunit H
MIVTAVAAMLVLFLLGICFAVVLDGAIPAAVAGRPVGRPLAASLRRAALLLRQQRIATERPDLLNWLFAPGAFLALALVGMSVVPFSPGVAVNDIETGIVLWGACEALAVVVVFLHGWSANAPMPLIGAYRYVAIGLPAMLVSMFVLIAAALPAQSLSVGAIVESQHGLWNAVRQPLGLPLFVLLGLSLTFRGPFGYADPFDLAGGTSAEDSGALRAAWQLARLAMLVSFAAMAASLFLGGYLGPWLPGPIWLFLKTAGVLVVVTAAGHLIARVPPSRMLTFLWIVFLPLSFLDLIVAGVESLP